MAVYFGTTCADAVTYNGNNVSLAYYNGTCVFPDEPVTRVLVYFCPLSEANLNAVKCGNVDFSTPITFESQPLICFGDLPDIQCSLYSYYISNVSVRCDTSCTQKWDCCLTYEEFSIQDGYCHSKGSPKTTKCSSETSGTSYRGVCYSDSSGKQYDLTSNTEYSMPEKTISPYNAGWSNGACSQSQWQISSNTYYGTPYFDPDGWWGCEGCRCTFCGYAQGWTSATAVNQCRCYGSSLSVTVCAKYCDVWTCITCQLTSQPRQGYLVWANKMVRYYEPTVASTITETVTNTTTRYTGTLNLGRMKIDKSHAHMEFTYPAGICMCICYGMNYIEGEFYDWTSDTYVSTHCKGCFFEVDENGYVDLVFDIDDTFTHYGNPNKRDFGVSVNYATATFVDENGKCYRGCYLPSCMDDLNRGAISWSDFIENSVWGCYDGSWTGTVTCSKIATYNRYTCYKDKWYNGDTAIFCGQYDFGV